MSKPEVIVDGVVYLNGAIMLSPQQKAATLWAIRRRIDWLDQTYTQCEERGILTEVYKALGGAAKHYLPKED